MQLVDGSHGRRARRTGPDAVPRAQSPRPGDRGHPRARAARSAFRRHRARACRKSQEEDEVVTFDTVMPNTIARFDDELQTIAGTLTDATDVTARGRRLLNRGRSGDGNKARVNPVAADPA